MTHLTNSPTLCHYHITFGNQHSSLNFYINFVDWTYECDYEALVIVYHYIACFFVLLMMSQRTKNHPFYALLIFNFMHTIIFSI